MFMDADGQHVQNAQTVWAQTLCFAKRFRPRRLSSSKPAVWTGFANRAPLPTTYVPQK
jgi:hypothetical protein